MSESFSLTEQQARDEMVRLGASFFQRGYATGSAVASTTRYLLGCLLEWLGRRLWGCLLQLHSNNNHRQAQKEPERHRIQKFLLARTVAQLAADTGL